MSKKTVTLKSPNDETVHLFVDGKHLATATHDEDGWAGMNMLENVAKLLARELGANFEV